MNDIAIIVEQSGAEIMKFVDPKPSVFSQFDMKTNTRTVQDIYSQPQAGWEATTACR